MFTRSITLFTIFGFTIRLDLSWFVIAALVVWSLAAGLFPENYPDLAPATYWWMGAAGALGLFASIVLHELGHALEARRQGIPMRGITLFIFGGVAEMTDEPPTARAEFLMAIAGPIVSVLIAAGCFGLERLGLAAGWPGPALGILWYLWWINALLVAFNVLPAFPLDGGRVLRSALWQFKGDLRWATRVTSSIGSGFGIALIALGLFVAIFLGAFGGLWWALIGWFLYTAARMSYQQLLVRRALEGEPVHRFMQPEVRSVPASLSVRDFVDHHVYRHHFKMFPVVEDGRLTGCVTTRQVRQLPHEQWAERTVGDLALGCNEENSIDPDADAMHALARMRRAGSSRLLVVENGELRGILTLKDLLHFISLKVELEER